MTQIVMSGSDDLAEHDSRAGNEPARAEVNGSGQSVSGPFREDRFSVQAWLEGTAERRLAGTKFGRAPGHDRPDPIVFEDPLVNQVIKMDIATFLIAERHSVKNTARMISLAPSQWQAQFLATQVLDEARHFEAFSERLGNLGASELQIEALMKRYSIPQLDKFFGLIDEQIDRGDFAGACVGQNLILEGMAFPVYRYEMKYWSRLDPGLSDVIRGAFADEVHHTGFGESFLRSAVASDVQTKNRVQRLVREFRLLMREMFEAVLFHYVGLYQCAADAHMEVMGDIEIFKGKRMADVREEEQVRILLAEVDREYERRALGIGLGS